MISSLLGVLGLCMVSAPIHTQAFNQGACRLNVSVQLDNIRVPISNGNLLQEFRVVYYYQSSSPSVAVKSGQSGIVDRIFDFNVAYPSASWYIEYNLPYQLATSFSASNVSCVLEDSSGSVTNIPFSMSGTQNIDYYEQWSYVRFLLPSSALSGNNFNCSIHYTGTYITAPYGGWFTWDDTLDYPSGASAYLPYATRYSQMAFGSNNGLFRGFHSDSAGDYLYYVDLDGNDVKVYNWTNDTWTDERYRYISLSGLTFYGSRGSSLKSWFNSNGVYGYTPPALPQYEARDLLFSVVDTPLYFLYSLMNFEFFGATFFSIFLGLLTLGVGVFVIKKVL